MSSSLAPALLLAMPQLVDSNFVRTVVLLCKHTEEGAFGLVMNRPLLTSGPVVVNLDPPVSTDRELEVWEGGPVEPQRSWILVGADPEDLGESDQRLGRRVARVILVVGDRALRSTGGVGELNLRHSARPA